VPFATCCQAVIQRYSYLDHSVSELNNSNSESSQKHQGGAVAQSYDI